MQSDSHEYLRELEISNYKKFDKIHVKNIGRVNLITGDNNVGKTTLLEALMFPEDNELIMDFYHHTLCSRNIHYHVREKSSKNPIFPTTPYVQYIFKDLTKELIFKYVINNSAKEKKIEYLKLNNFTEVDKQLIRRTGTDIRNVPHWLKFYENNVPTVIDFLHYDEFNNASYYPNENFIESHINDNTEIERVNTYIENRYNKIINNFNTKTELIQLVNDFIPGTKDIELRPIGDLGSSKTKLIFISSDMTKGEYMPMTTYGNGFIRYFKMVLSLLMPESKTLKFAIDEIENGIHFTRLKPLWRVILKLAQDSNLQLFITTHSKECIEAFCEVAEEFKGLQNDLRLIEIKEVKMKDEVLHFAETSEFNEFNASIQSEINNRGGNLYV